MTNRLDQVQAYVMAVLAGGVGLTSLAVFGLFLWTGGLGWVDLKMGWRSALLWDSALCLVFFLQHSGMIRRPFRRWMGKAVPIHYHGAVYTLASGAALVLLSTCWQPSRVDVMDLDGSVRWLTRGLILSAFAGILWCFRSLGGFDAFGAQAVISQAKGAAPPSASLSIRGPYRWVRHPIYFFGLVVFWARLVLPLDWLLFNVLFTVWFVIGSVFEERDLVAEFGDAYRAYQRTVPMLLPWPPRRP